MAKMNRTLKCDESEINELSKELMTIELDSKGNSVHKLKPDDFKNKILHNTYEDAVYCMPEEYVDLAIIDPPYNLTKDYNGKVFTRFTDDEDYHWWFYEVISDMKKILKKNATIYVCSDWRTSTVIEPVLNRFFNVQNRITWEREKGRGAKNNWKNNTEDIWFCTMHKNKYFFDVERVKLKKKVLAPYKDEKGNNKDWVAETDGNYRMTYPSNIWTDLSIPFWSMHENTDHPTQKPEKLIAKLILASSNEGDMVFDGFSGSGTTSVVAKKAGQELCGA